MHNFILQKIKNLINYITINFLFSRNFTSMEYIRRKCILIVNLSKFTFNKVY